MWMLLTAVCVARVLLVQGQNAMSEKEASLEQLIKAETRLSDQVRAILEHYKQEDPVGIPGAPIPDPMPVPDMTKKMAMTTMTMQNLQVFGLSMFRIDHLGVELNEMKLTVALRLEVIHIVGNYTMKYFFSRSQGLFNITLTNVQVEGTAKMSVVDNGQLLAENIDMDISFDSMNMVLENDAMSSFLRGILTSMAPFIFEGIKPFILKEVNQNVRGDINKEISKYEYRFPNSISPLDLVISDARRLVQFMGYDPYHFPNYNYTTGMTNIHISQIWLSGLASFHRVGNITFAFEDHVMKAGAHVGTLKLGGLCHWDLEIGLLSRAGVAEFTVDYLQLYLQVSQPLDTRKSPRLDTVDFKLGDFEIRVEGMGSFDYVIELVANVLPNMLRYQIMNTIETKLRAGLQQALDRVDVQEIIEEKLNDLDGIVI